MELGLNLVPNFLAYAGSALLLWTIGMFLFDFTTKSEEWSLIKGGNKAAAFVLGGRGVGLAAVLYSAISHSVHFWDMLAWGGIGIAAQVATFYIFEIATPKFNIGKAIDEDNQAVGILLMFISLSVGLIVAGCLTP